MNKAKVPKIFEGELLFSISGQNSSFKYFQENAFVSKIFSNLSDPFILAALNENGLKYFFRLLVIIKSIIDPEFRSKH